jgi:hypothetical protein
VRPLPLHSVHGDAHPIERSALDAARLAPPVWSINGAKQSQPVATTRKCPSEKGQKQAKSALLGLAINDDS